LARKYITDGSISKNTKNIVIFPGEKIVSLKGIAPVLSNKKCPCSATFNGADPENPPCQTSKPAPTPYYLD
jgi:hypothetical protein